MQEAHRREADCVPVRALLVGPNVGLQNHPQRDAVLVTRYGIEVTSCTKATSAAELPSNVDVFVLEYADMTDRILSMVPRIKRMLPGVIIILVNGGLSQMQRAWAFYQGVADYFPLPASFGSWELLAARIVNLVKGPRMESRRR